MVVTVLKEGYILLFIMRSPLTRQLLIKRRYTNQIRSSYLQEALHSHSQKQAMKQGKFQSSLAFFQKTDNMVSHLGPEHSEFISHGQNLQKVDPESVRLSLRKGEWVISLDLVPLTSTTLTTGVLEIISDSITKVRLIGSRLFRLRRIVGWALWSSSSS